MHFRKSSHELAWHLKAISFARLTILSVFCLHHAYFCSFWMTKNKSVRTTMLDNDSFWRNSEDFLMSLERWGRWKGCFECLWSFPHILDSFSSHFSHSRITERKRFGRADGRTDRSSYKGANAFKSQITYSLIELWTCDSCLKRLSAILSAVLSLWSHKQTNCPTCPKQIWFFPVLKVVTCHVLFKIGLHQKY